MGSSIFIIIVIFVYVPFLIVPVHIIYNKVTHLNNNDTSTKGAVEIYNNDPTINKPLFWTAFSIWMTCLGIFLICLILLIFIKTEGTSTII